MSRLRANTITNKTANGAPKFSNGLTGTAGTFTGAITAASGTITGNLGVAGVLTYEDVTNIDSVGVITARSGIRIGATGANTLITGNGTGIGIGITTPQEELHIRAATPVIRLEDGDNARQSQIVGSDGNLRLDADNNNAIADTNIAFRTDGGERLRIGPVGQLGIGGANYGTSGQVLTSAGSGSAVQWATPAGGKILQVVNVFKGDGFTTNSTSFTDITGLSISITPSSTSSKIMLSCSMGAAGTRINNGDYGNGIRVMRDIGGGGYSNNNKLNGAADGSRDRITFKGHGWSYNNDHMPGGVGFTGVDDPNTTSAVTYKVQVVCQSSSYAFFLNRNSTNADNSSIAQARSQTSLIAMEIGG